MSICPPAKINGSVLMIVSLVWGYHVRCLKPGGVRVKVVQKGNRQVSVERMGIPYEASISWLVFE